MDIYEAIILGIIQGITEWLPISSSGQGMLTMLMFFGVSAKEAFSIAIYLHFGTLLAVLVYLRQEIIDIFKVENKKILQFLIISTIFTGLVGLPLYKFLSDAFGEFSGGIFTILIGILLIITGIILHQSKETSKEARDIELKDMVLAGCAQGITILPGISRSGITVAALLWLKFNQQTALKLSFLMSIPAVLGALAIESLNSTITPFSQEVAAGIIFAFIFGILTMHLLLKIAQKLNFANFCIFLGGVSAVLGYLLL